jgi:uncharacterized protein YdeI (YjbR/CyaY-like superfamily)
MSQKIKQEPHIIPFGSQAAWREWLEQNHTLECGIWLQFYKKGSGTPSVNYAQALDEALCFGWIDGQLKRSDENFYLQKFTPRRKRSMWSKRNIEHIARLEQEGKMADSGRRQVEAAQADGRWDRSYDSPGNMTVPEDLLMELSKVPANLAFFDSLNQANKYAITWRLQSASEPKIREKRLKSILEMMSKREKFHP